jgi:predicted PurR-regulated permease PerM
MDAGAGDGAGGAGAGGAGAGKEAEPVLYVDLDWRSVAVAAATVLGFVAILAFLDQMPRTTTAVILAVFLVLALDPVVVKTASFMRCGRSVAVGLVLLTVTLALGLALVFLVPPTVDQARQLGTEAPRVVRQLADLPIVGDRLQSAGAPEKLQEAIQKLPERLSLGALAKVGKSVADALGVAGLTLLLTIGLLLDAERLLGLVRRLIPAARRDQADQLGRLFYDVVGRYAIGSLLVAGMTGLVVLIAGLIMGVPLTPIATVWAILWDLIPQVGGAVGGATFVLLAFTKSATVGVLAAVVFLLYLQLRNHLVAPLITGASVQLSPLAVMVAVLIGVTAGGLVGGLIVVPVTGAAKAALRELRPSPKSRGPEEIVT